MFTGIIEEIGTIKELNKTANSARIICMAEKTLKNIKKGDSIAVNGVCLTVISHSYGLFEADISPETMEKSNLDLLKPGDKCNLEHAICAGEPFGGHFVTGHIDGPGKILTVTTKGNSLLIKISASRKLMKNIAPKGSVTIDGVSLTPFECTNDTFDVSVIPLTQSQTILKNLKPGDQVNIECDILSKYIETIIEFRQIEIDEKKVQKIDKEFLKKKGFLI